MSTQTNGSIRGWITYRKLESLLGGDQRRRLHRFPAGSLSYSNILTEYERNDAGSQTMRSLTFLTVFLGQMIHNTCILRPI